MDYVDEVELPSPTNVLDAEKWNIYLGAIWSRLFKRANLSSNGSIVEVAPGILPKIGLGLKGIGFRGVVYVIEPDADSRATIHRIYSALLPQAEIIAIDAPLQNAIAALPRKLDGVFANHPLDDMLIGEAVGENARAETFRNIHTKTSAEMRDLWTKLTRHKKGLPHLRELVASQWKTLVEHSNPNWLGISQYETLALRRNEITGFDTQAQHALREIESIVGPTPAEFQTVLTTFRQNPKHWLFSSPKKGS